MEHEKFMKLAILEAQKAAEEGEIPVGAVIVCNGRPIARAHNQTELLTDVTAHAEIIAITAASNHLSSKYLTDCTLYVTLEPCVMCAGALAWSQISNIVYGASDDKKGYSTYSDNILHKKTTVTKGILEEECANLMIEFFQNKR